MQSAKIDAESALSPLCWWIIKAAGDNGRRIFFFDFQHTDVI